MIFIEKWISGKSSNICLWGALPPQGRVRMLLYVPNRPCISAGALPAGLAGRYLRNGPNPVSAPEPATYHWFTGTGMVHGIRLRDGRADWYRNRWVRSQEVSAALGEPWRRGPVHADMDFAPNTNVIGHAGRTLALVEAGALPYELTYELDTVGPFDFNGTLVGGYSADPKRDPCTGDLHAISYFWGWGNMVRYTVVDTAGSVRRSVDVEVGGPVAIHDMSLTERFAIVYDLPVLFSAEAAMSGVSFPYRWDPDYRARVGLLPRDDTAFEQDRPRSGAQPEPWFSRILLRMCQDSFLRSQGGHR